MKQTKTIRNKETYFYKSFNFKLSRSWHIKGTDIEFRDESVFGSGRQVTGVRVSILNLAEVGI